MKLKNVYDKTKYCIIVGTSFTPRYNCEKFCLHIPGFHAARLIKALEFEGFQFKKYTPRITRLDIK